jgi:flagellar hook protein FlgE
MMRSLFSAVSGLKAHQTKMDVIGNNIANVNTVAYKSQSVTFSDVYYQTTQSATGPNDTTGAGGTNPQQIGTGSAVGNIKTAISTQGASERTDDPYDLQISGDAFFIVSNQGNTYFTRAGNFQLDEAGALVTSTGANVMGWQVDENGEVQRDMVSALYVTSSEFTYTAPEATAGVTASGNVDASDTEASSFTLNFYDSLGNSYQAVMNLQYDSDASSTTVAVYTLEGGQISRNGVPTELQIEASSSFSFNAVSGAAMDAMSNITLTITGTDADVNLSTIGSAALEGTANAQSTTLVLDASGVTMYSDDTDIQCTRGYEVDGTTTGKGKAVGVMSSVGIDSYGRIIASYTNGDKNTLGQIAVATFSNPAGLEKVGDNLYASTMNSGLFDGIGEDISSTDGSITSGYLEMSNVDLSTEFTQMITTQRGFQANSRIITVSDTLLEELINLKR